MSRVWSGPAAEDRQDPGRPGELLAAAAAVPLLAAVALAAGLLPWGARAALGVALVVIGLHVRGLAAAAPKGPAGPGLLRAAGIGTAATGVVLAAVAVAIGLDGGQLKPVRPEGEISSSYAGVFEGQLGGVAGPLLGLALLGAGIWGLRTDGAGGRRERAARRPTGSGSATAAALAGAGGALALFALTGQGVLGIGADARAVLLLVAASAVAAAVVRDRGRSAWSRAAGFGAGVLVALVVGEGTSLLDAVAGDLAGVQPPLDYHGIVRGLQAAMASGAAAVLLAFAVHRRDGLVGLLPFGVLVQATAVRGIATGVGVLLVPVLVAVLMVATLLGRGPLAGRLAPPVARVVLLAAALAGVAAGAGLASQGLVSFGSLDRVDMPGLISGVLAVAVVLAGGLLLVRTRVPGDPGDGPVGTVGEDGDRAVRRVAPTLDAGAIATAVATIAIVGLYFLHPVWSTVRALGVSPFEDRWVQVAALAVELGVAAFVVHRRQTPLVIAGGALVLADVLGHVGQVLLFANVDHGPGVLAEAAVLSGPSAGLLLLLGGAAALGPERRVRSAQAAAVATGLALALTVDGTAGALAAGITDDDGNRIGATLAGGQAAVALLLAVVVLAGTGLLAASAVRRRSAPAAGVVVLLGVLSGLLVAGIGVGVRDQATSGGFPSPSDAALGFDAVGSSLLDAGGGWAVGLALLAAALGDDGERADGDQGGAGDAGHGIPR
ncbi:hypothetical protein AB0L40_18125, partial [Patulibacter sp. NPDC049589]|uniref:hypothetical protein n=1 Tax=Patulibacter sp. NPDC049589 TaxID=3154731 RepID=UPI003443D6F2